MAETPLWQKVIDGSVGTIADSSILVRHLRESGLDATSTIADQFCETFGSDAIAFEKASSMPDCEKACDAALWLLGKYSLAMCLAARSFHTSVEAAPLQQANQRTPIYKAAEVAYRRALKAQTTAYGLGSLLVTTETNLPARWVGALDLFPAPTIEDDWPRWTEGVNQPNDLAEAFYPLVLRKCGFSFRVSPVRVRALLLKVLSVAAGTSKKSAHVLKTIRQQHAAGIAFATGYSEAEDLELAPGLHTDG